MQSIEAWAIFARALIEKVLLLRGGPIQDETSAEFAGNVSSDDTADLTQLRAPDDKISEMPSHPTRPKMEAFDEMHQHFRHCPPLVHINPDMLAA